MVEEGIRLKCLKILFTGVIMKKVEKTGLDDSDGSIMLTTNRPSSWEYLLTQQKEKDLTHCLVSTHWEV